MKAKIINKSDFTFTICGYGQYKVYYISPIRKIKYAGFIIDMEIIDLTKNCDYPKAKNLRQLKNNLTKITYHGA